MAAPTSITPVRTLDVLGNQRKTVTRVVGAAAYATGGDTLTAANLGLRVVQDASVTVVVTGTGSIVAADYDIANGKLKYYTATAQFGNGSDASPFTFQVVAFGY